MPWNMTDEEHAEWRLASAERRLANYLADRERAECDGRTLTASALDRRITDARADVEQYQAAIDARNVPDTPSEPAEPAEPVRAHAKWNQPWKAA